MVQQVPGGGAEEDAVLSVAGQSDSLQSRLPVLRHMEDHAKFQVLAYWRGTQCVVGKGLSLLPSRG